MRFIRLALFTVPLVGFTAACEEDNVFGLGPGNGTPYTAALVGENVRPIPVGTSATAAATVTVLEPDIGQTETTLGFTIDVSGVSSATAAHIHLGGAAVAAGQVLATLYTNQRDTLITSSRLVSGSLAASAVAVSLDSLSTLMTTGAAYIDIHSATNPIGLVRGQLIRPGDAPPTEGFAASSLTGAKQRPTPVTTTASGSAALTVQNGGQSIRFNVTVAGITGVTMAHIHTGVADSAGPIAVTLFSSSTPTGSLTGTLANGTFNASNIQLPGVSLDSLLSLMRLGRTYVNVRTTLNPNGEIRGQLEPVTILPP